MPSNQDRTFQQSLRAHETTIVEIAAVLTSAPRWIITLTPIDKANLNTIIGSDGWWDWVSAFLSVAFAVVEIWATAMIMRSFVLADRTRDKVVLFSSWLLSLVVLALMQIPPLYAGLMSTGVASLPQPWPVVYVVAVSIAAFVVIAGVSYSDRVRVSSNKSKMITDKLPENADKNTITPLSSGFDVDKERDAIKKEGIPEIGVYRYTDNINGIFGTAVAVKESLTTEQEKTERKPSSVSKPFVSYSEFQEYAVSQGDSFPQDVSGITKHLKDKGQPYQTAIKWAKKFVAEKAQ